MIILPSEFVKNTFSSVAEYINSPLGWIIILCISIEVVFYVIEKILLAAQQAREYARQVSIFAEALRVSRYGAEVSPLPEEPAGLAKMFIPKITREQAAIERAVQLHRRFTGIMKKTSPLE